MNKKSLLLIVFALLVSTSFSWILTAQSDLMQDVDAVKEGAEDDLYAPDDDEPTQPNSTTTTPPKKTTVANPTTEAPKTSATESADLNDLPVIDDVKPAAAMTGVESAKSSQLTAMRIYPLKDRMRVELQTTQPVDYLPEKISRNNQFAMNLGNTTLSSTVSKSPVSAKEYGGNVNQIQAYESKSSLGSTARVVISLNSLSDPIIKQEGNRILVEFMNEATEWKNDRNNKDISNELPEYETLMSMTGKKVFRGTKVNFKSKDASVSDVLAFISQASGKNFVLIGDQDKKVSLNIKNEPWDQVLALVLLNADLGYQKVGNTYRVMPVTKIRSELAEASKAQEEEDKQAAKATQLFPLSYAKTGEMIPQVQKFLKAEFGEHVVQDDRTNSIVVTALPKNIERVRKYIEAIDRQTPVIQIEARVVQANKDFSRQLGFDWNLAGALSLGSGNLTFRTALGSGGSTGGASSSGSSSGSVSSVAIGGLGGVQGGFTSTGTIKQIDAIVNLSESDSFVKELSRPSLTVLNNKEAKITDGTTFTFVNTASGSSANGTATPATIEAVLGLTVTPQVTNDNNVLLKVKLSRDLPGTALPGVPNIGINKRVIETETMIESGATMAIGGVYIREEGASQGGWPFLRKIPLFGRLFTSVDSKREAERELLMFISPRILNLDKSSMTSQSLIDAR